MRLALAVLLLVACQAQTVRRGGVGDEAFEQRDVPRVVSDRVVSDREARDAYAEYLAACSGKGPARFHALLRYAELELDDSEGRRAVEALEAIRRDYPATGHADRVLYLLARAYEQQGQVERAEAVLQQLVAGQPASPFVAEASFRQAEILFSLGRYAAAARAYARLLDDGGGRYRDYARYKRGWCRYKRGHYRPALEDFARLLELREEEGSLREDSLRAAALALSYRGGAAAIDAHFEAGARAQAQVYAALSGLYLQQQRFTDAAETAAATPNAIPTPRLRRGCCGRRARAMRTLAAYHHARTQKREGKANYVGAECWYSEYLQHYPTASDAGEYAFLLAELLAAQGRWRQAYAHYQAAAYELPPFARRNEAAYAALLIAERLAQEAVEDKAVRWRDFYVTGAARFAESFPVDGRRRELHYQTERYAEALAHAEGGAP